MTIHIKENEATYTKKGSSANIEGNGRKSNSL